ncbi:MAG: hypothetical protein HY904_20800 [Deltaproteobacteria bacterium]|nr:hypothetical protein [Deltaproteobacteria bacterium]
MLAMRLVWLLLVANHDGVADAPAAASAVSAAPERQLPWPVLFSPLGTPQFLMGRWARGALAATLLVAAPLPSAVFFGLAWAATRDCVAPAQLLAGRPAVTPASCRPWGAGRIFASDTPRRDFVVGMTVLQYASLLLVPAAYLFGVMDAFLLREREQRHRV